MANYSIVIAFDVIVARRELRERLGILGEKPSDAERMGPTKAEARNVVLFVGDGMGPVTVTAARFYMAKSRGQLVQETHFAWDRFPFTGITKVKCTQPVMCRQCRRGYIINSNQSTQIFYMNLMIAL